MIKTPILARSLVPGEASGLALVSRQALSFWGGFDPLTGEIIDRRHDRLGAVVTGKIFVLPRGKGSSTGSAVLLEGIRNGTAPAAILLASVDPILALGGILAQELYQKTVPILLLSEADWASIQEEERLAIASDGSIERTLDG